MLRRSHRIQEISLIDDNIPQMTLGAGLIMEWRRYGKLHRDDDLPARVWPNGSKEWYRDGLLHRTTDEPAVIIYGFGIPYQEWYIDGKRHREGDEPALISHDGSKKWYKHGELHREDDKPAVIQTDGTQRWYSDGLCHRGGNKPAVIGNVLVSKWCLPVYLQKEYDEVKLVSMNILEWWENGKFIKKEVWDPSQHKIGTYFMDNGHMVYQANMDI